MPNPIVVVNTTVALAPIPSALQQTGALVSAGATTLTAGTYSLLTQLSDLTPLLSSSLAISSISWSAGTAIVTTAATIPGRTSGDIFRTTIAGATPAGYNGLVSATVTGGNSFTYPLAVNPGAETVAGTYTPPSQGALVAMATTFFAQGSGQSVYVLELGPSDGTTGPPLLQTWITNNPQFFYSYLVPVDWDGTSAYLALLASYESPTAMTYFFTTTSTGNYSSYPQVKNIVAEVNSPGSPLTEFTLAAAFQQTLAYRPSSANRMTPLSFRYLYGVTNYPTQNNGPLLTTLLANNVNYIGAAPAGSPSPSILRNGRVLSGLDFSWWYSADSTQILLNNNVTQAVVAGSNNPDNPLYYNQQGINQLQDVCVATLATLVSYGQLSGTVNMTALDAVTFQSNLDDGDYAGQNVVNAIPFSTYVLANPSDYGIGRYAGLSVVALPQLGFQQIIINLLVTDILLF